MDDSEICQLVVTIYEQIREQQAAIDQSVLAAEAIQHSMREAIPEFNKLYAKHFLALLDGQIGSLQAERIRQLDVLIEGLRT